MFFQADSGRKIVSQLACCATALIITEGLPIQAPARVVEEEQRLMGVIQGIARGGVGILLIEQFTHLALKVADAVYVLDRSSIRFSGYARRGAGQPTDVTGGLSGAVV